MHIISPAGNSPRDQSEIEEEEDRRSSEKCRRTRVSACGEKIRSEDLYLRVKNSDTVLTEWTF